MKAIELRWVGAETETELLGMNPQFIQRLNFAP